MLFIFEDAFSFSSLNFYYKWCSLNLRFPLMEKKYRLLFQICPIKVDKMKYTSALCQKHWVENMMINGITKDQA